MKRTIAVIGALALLAPSVRANLGETHEQLVSRAGGTEPERLDNGFLEFKTSTGFATIVMYNNVSVLEFYEIDTIPLVRGEPPSAVVRDVLNANLPGEKWVESSSAGSDMDYVMSTADGRFIAALKYRNLSNGDGSRADGTVWMLMVGSADAYIRLGNLMGRDDKVGEVKESAPVVVSPAATPAPKARPPKVSSWTTDHLVKRRAELVQRFKDNSFGIYFGPMRWVSHAIDEKKSREEFLAISNELNRRGIRVSTEIPKEGD